MLFELEYGIAKSNSPKKSQAQLKEISSLVEVLPFGNLEARFSALLRAQATGKKWHTNSSIWLIADTALAQQRGILVTSNTNEFTRVLELKIENWYELQV